MTRNSAPTGTNAARNSAPTGTNMDRNGFSNDKTWDEATDQWDDVTDTWDNYKSEMRRTENGTNMVRN